jgi:hypothetical protein
VGLLIVVSACGDSTGPSPSRLDSNAALQSLALGMGAVSGFESPTAPQIRPSFAGIAPLLDQMEVTIDGKSQTMFALGLRQSFPAGTCEENIFIIPTFPPPPGVCTPPQFGLTLILWQSHSASAPPDRLIFIAADAGTSNFDFFNALPRPADVFPALALYMEGEENFWVSLSGTLTSQVAATNQSCELPLPPYAKAGSCSVATFDEQGAIVFEGFSETVPSTKRLNLTIPRRTIHGLWLVITETQPVTFPDYQRTSRWLGR